MITEKELIEAIEACEKEPLTPSKIAKLADFYIIYDHLFGVPDMLSFKDQPTEGRLKTGGETEFLRAVNGKKTDRVLSIMSELAESIKVLHPNMYEHMLDLLNDE